MVSLQLSFAQKCCAGTVSDFCTNSPSVSNCKALVGLVATPPHLMLKVIANVNVFESFSERDDETDDSNDKLKGIEVLR